MGAEQVRFETPEDVELRFELAGPGSRAAAALVDGVIIALLAAGAVAGLGALGVLAFRFRDLFDPDSLESLGGLALALLIGVVFGVNLLYYVGLEWALAGRTLGKKWLGLRVVRDGGYALDLPASALRNVLRSVDMLPGVYLVGLVSMILSTERRRLGDFVAGTLVVRESRARRPEARFVGERYSTLAERRYALTREHVGRLDAATLQLLDDFYAREEALAPEARERLAGTLAESLALRMKLEVPRPLDTAGARALLKETYLALAETL